MIAFLVFRDDVHAYTHTHTLMFDFIGMQIDPFGHSQTEAWLLGAESGFESLYWGRTDYQDMELRTSLKGHENNQWPQWVWQGSQSLGASAQLMAGQLGSGGYGTNIGCKSRRGGVAG
jgi:hypothetical protein